MDWRDGCFRDESNLRYNEALNIALTIRRIADTYWALSVCDKFYVRF